MIINPERLGVILMNVAFKFDYTTMYILIKIGQKLPKLAKIALLQPRTHESLKTMTRPFSTLIFTYFGLEWTKIIVIFDFPTLEI